MPSLSMVPLVSDCFSFTPGLWLLIVPELGKPLNCGLECRSQDSGYEQEMWEDKMRGCLDISNAPWVGRGTVPGTKGALGVYIESSPWREWAAPQATWSVFFLLIFLILLQGKKWELLKLVSNLITRFPFPYNLCGVIFSYSHLKKPASVIHVTRSYLRIDSDTSSRELRTTVEWSLIKLLSKSNTSLLSPV